MHGELDTTGGNVHMIRCWQMTLVQQAVAHMDLRNVTDEI